MDASGNQMEPILRQRVEDIVYEKLLANIKDNVWKAGDKIPSETELCALLGVSREMCIRDRYRSSWTRCS